MNNYKVGSLFAGVGGVCQAFKNSSTKVIWANEIDSNASLTYILNHKTTKLIQDDIKNISKDNLESIDILTAGFPCQPFSQAGHGKGFQDERGELFFDVVRLLKEMQPKAYFLENVRTLSTHDKGNTFEIIKNELANAGYSFIPFILNAAEYTHIPQGRERIYIVGFKDESDYFFDKPIKINQNNSVINCNHSNSFKIPAKIDKKTMGVQDFLDSSTVQENDYYLNNSNKIHLRVQEAVKCKNTVYQYRRYYVRENKSNICLTFTANMGSGGHNIPIILDDNAPRRLTPKEFKLPSEVARDSLGFYQILIRWQLNIMNKTNKHENYEILNLIGYGLAKYNDLFIQEFGFNTKTSFYTAMVEYGVAETESVLKNRQDLFDPFFDNGRKGWWQKGDTYIHRKHFIDSLFGSLNVASYVEVVKMYLQDKFKYKQNESMNIKPVIKSQFKQLQKTGLEAEMYFLSNYNNVKIFNGGLIEDARLLGDGYDFQIEVNNNYFLAEVKGVRKNKGSIRLTFNEYNMAIEYKEKYILSIISNLNDIPKITIIPDPINQLNFDRNIIKQEQITFNTSNIIW